MNKSELQAKCDLILENVTSAKTRVPGVVAMVTDENQNIYEGVRGVKSLSDNSPLNIDSTFCIFSCTKGITAAVIMKLVEDGKLDLDAPASQYCPDLAEVQVLDGFAPDGSIKLRAPKQAITTRMLLLHTAGFGYDFFNENYKRLSEEYRLRSIVTGARDAIKAPLLFDPGSKWEYGVNMDWAGLVAEGVTGKRLGDAMQEYIFDPLGMENIGFTMNNKMSSDLAKIHARNADGSLTPMDDFILEQAPEIHMGGHGLYTNVGNYMKFIRMFLNDGKGINGQVLKPETIQQMVANGLGKMKITALPGVIPSLSNDAEFFPGINKSWSLSFMVNDETAPTGRPAGAIGWAGLANLYYWIDIKNKLGGFWATQILPFADATSFGGYMDFESAVYDNI